MTRFYTAAAITAAILGLQPLAGQQLPAEPLSRITASQTLRKALPASAHRVPAGALSLPYTETFSSSSALDNFYVRDANFDGTTWKVAAEQLRIQANNARAMNDWVITAPVHLEAGKEYEFSFDARAHNSYYTEKIHAALGSEPEASEMTISLLPVTEVSETTYKTYNMSYTPAATGTYYFGIQGCSDAGSFYLWVDNLHIAAKAVATAPAAPQLSGIPDYDRKPEATFTIVAPETDINGDPVGEMSKIVLSREGTAVHTIDNPVAGQSYTFTDRLPEGSEERYYSYTALPYCGEMAGQEATMQMFMGVNLPGPAKNARAIEDNNSGYIVVTWDKAETDIDGYPMNPSLIHYVVYANNGELLDEDITENFCAAQYLSLTQRYHFYIVMSETAAGLNEEDFPQSNMVALGSPYTLPYAESFVNGKLSTAFAIEYNEGGQLSQTAEAPSIGATPADDDNGFLTYTAAENPSPEGKAPILMAGKIKIPSDAANPVLTFQYFKVAGSDARIAVAVNESPYFDMDAFLDLSTVEVSAGTDGWNRVTVPLADYRDAVIKPAFRFLMPTGGSTVAIDDIRIFDQLDHNLKVRAASGPHKVYANDEMPFNIEIENIGAEEAAGYSVSLLCGGRTVASAEGPAILPGKRASLQLSHTPTVLDAGELTCSLRIDYDSDNDLSDNVSDDFKVIIGTLPLPRAAELTATSAEGSVALAWQPVDLATARCEALTEDFEDYTPFAINDAGDWTFRDLDGARTWGISGMDFPNEQEPMAFIVFNASGYHSTMAARSGLQYMSALSSRGGVDSDDWLISPLLSGDAQEISLYVSSQSDSYGNEKFQILASTGSLETTDFAPVYSNDKVPAIEWARHTCTLPEGTRRFAIRSYATNLMFRVDDVTYIPALPELSLVGYNVYRDGERITPQPVATASFTDRPDSDGTHTYRVTAVYDKGESRPSDSASADFSALSAVEAPDAHITVRGTTIICDAPFEVYDLAGRHAASARGSVTLAPGIYLVKTGAVTAKVLLR